MNAKRKHLYDYTMTAQNKIMGADPSVITPQVVQEVRTPDGRRKIYRADGHYLTTL